MPPSSPTPPRSPQCPLYPFWSQVPTVPASPPIHMTPLVTCIMAPNTPTPPSFLLLSFSMVVTLQLTVFMQLKCSFSIIVIFNCHHFATDHLHAVKTLIFYHHHFQLAITLHLTIFSAVKLSQFLQYLPKYAL